MVYLDRVVDESRPLPLSLQETANIEAYAQRNVISIFIFKNKVRMINQGVIYSQNRIKVLVTSTRANKIMWTCVNVHARIRTFLESSHTEIIVVPVKTRQPNSAWVDCVLSVQNVGRSSDTSVCHSWLWSRSVLPVLTDVSQSAEQENVNFLCKFGKSKLETSESLKTDYGNEVLKKICCV